ncbi:hypothetical protein U1Q18_037436 [Sarracenia purpurea var. burkii]
MGWKKGDVRQEAMLVRQEAALACAGDGGEQALEMRRRRRRESKQRGEQRSFALTVMGGVAKVDGDEQLADGAI